MNGHSLADLAKARLSAFTPWTVYAHGIPDGTLPDRYYLIWCSEGTERSTRAAGTVNVQTPVLWVRAVSRNPRGNLAGAEAAWGAAQCRQAFRHWKPEGRWLVNADGISQAPTRSDALADQTVYSALEQFSLRSSIPGPSGSSSTS